MSPLPIPRGALVALLIAFAGLWFFNLEARKLIRPDEGRYASIAREMAASGDFVTPRLNGLKYFEKPPLQYWASALAMRAFGPRHWTARLWPALNGFLGVLLVGYAASRLHDPTRGLAAAAVLGSFLWYAAIGHLNTLDMSLTFGFGLALCGFLLATREAATRAERRGWMLAAWVGLAWAVLSKGLVGLVLPGLTLAVYCLVQRDASILKRLQWGLGLPLFLALVVPWFVAVSLRNPEFARFFFVHEHFQRYLESGHRREGAWWYFVPLLVAGALPWVAAYVPAAPALARELRAAKPVHPERLLLAWSAVVFVFFSASHSKLPSYILPMFPALALLLAGVLPGLDRRALAALGLLMVLFGLGVAAVSPLAPRFATDNLPAEALGRFEPWLVGAGACLAAAGVVGTVLVRRDRVAAAIIAWGFGGLAAAQLFASGHDEFSPYTSSYQLLREVRARTGGLDPAVPFYSVRTYEQTLPFYLERTVTLVEFRDEFDLGLTSEPGKGIPTLAGFLARWNAQAQAYAIMDTDEYEALAAQGVPMRLLGRSLRRVIVSRR